MKTTSRLGLAIVAALMTLTVAPLASAEAEPALTIVSPANGSVSGTRNVSFEGGTNDETDPVTLTIEGPGATITPAVTLSGTTWSTSAVRVPEDGGYTVRAEQGEAERATATTTFIVNTRVPAVTISEPAIDDENVEFSGHAGTEPGDSAEVILKVYEEGASEGEQPLREVSAVRVGAEWHSAAITLPLGGYYVRALQEDPAGPGRDTRSFTISSASPIVPVSPVLTPAAASPSPPVASFAWVPANPTLGQSVSLVSNSTDASSTIDAFAWDPGGTGSFVAGGPAITTSFATAGAHVVHLRVTDGNGLSAVATRTVNVGEAPLILMQPFPIVRIAGTLTASGARVKLLTVQAPLAAKVAVSCAGHGCPTKPESRLVAASSKSKTVAALLTFTHFERALRAGTVLQIRVSKAGEVGKFTSFKIRWHKLPLRSDACLRPTSATPIACPAAP